MQHNTRLVEEALQRVYHGADGGPNRMYGEPGLWKYIGKGPRAANNAMNKAFISIANLGVTLSHPQSTLFLTPWH